MLALATATDLNQYRANIGQVNSGCRNAGKAQDQAHANRGDRQGHERPNDVQEAEEYGTAGQCHPKRLGPLVHAFKVTGRGAQAIDQGPHLNAQRHEAQGNQNEKLYKVQ